MRDFTPVDTNLTPMEQENHVLNWFRDSGVTNPKKLVKMARRIENDIPQFIKRSIVDNVLNARYPQKFLAEAYKEMADYPVIIAGLIADGNHGMLMFGDDIVGLEINAKWSSWMKTDDRWNTNQEIELQDELVDNWVEENVIRSFEGRIVLFREFGFSGMPRKVFRDLSDEEYERLRSNVVTLKNLEKICG